jgi:DNA repair protein RadC
MSEKNTSAATQKYLIRDASSRAMNSGVCHLSEVELIALLLSNSDEGGPYDKATLLLSTFGSVRSLLTADFNALSTHGVTKRQFLTLHAGMELTRRHYQELMSTGSVLSNPRATREYVRMRLRDLPHEVFCCILLDNRNRAIKFVELFRGTIDGASVHPREVVKLALSNNAAALILVHNHPSGIAEPSQADELITRRLREALNLIDVRVLDHIVVGDSTCESFAERGLL